MKSNKDLYKDAFNEVKASQELKEKLMNIDKTNHKRKNKLSKITAVLAAAAIIVVSSVSVYAAVQLYNMHTEQKGKYAQTLVLEKSYVKSDEKPKFLKMNFSYMPENYVKANNTGNKVCYSLKNSCNGGISALFYDVSKQDKITDNRTNIVDSELTTINGHQALYLQEEPQKEYDKNNPVFDKDIYIYLEDYDYILYIYGGSDLTKEQLLKIAEGASVEECSESESAVILEWEDNINETPAQEDYNADIKTNFSQDNNNFFNVGDTVPITTADFDGNDVNVDVTVNSIAVADNLDMIADDNFKEKYLDENGKLKPLEVRFYENGDGVNILTSVETPIKTENYNLKFVYETVTYKNNTNRDINGICVYHKLYNIKDGAVQSDTLEKLVEEGSNIGYDTNFDYKLTEWAYDDFSIDNNNPNYIDLPANSQRTLHLGFFVLADDLTDGTYLSIDDGAIATDYDIITMTYSQSYEGFSVCKVK